MTSDMLDEAYDRLRGTGPEFDGWLSNHGPMAAEAMARHGYDERIPSWLDSYCRRLEPVPAAEDPIDDWREALGRPRRLGDWLRWFEIEVQECPWADVLHTWWPRLLPGIAAGATHGVIRVGHSVRALRDHGDSPEHVRELAQGLGYWAARWQPVPDAVRPAGRLDVADAIASLPVVRDQSGGINARLAQLVDVPDWQEAQRRLAPGRDAEAQLRDLVVGAVRRYATRGHGNPVMMVHAATAPNAVLRTLPSLPKEMWEASVSAAWTASAAIHAAYIPPEGVAPAPTPASTAEAFDLAVEHGDEHVIKLADTAVDAARWTGDDSVLSAVRLAVDLIEDE